MWDTVGDAQFRTIPQHGDGGTYQQRDKLDGCDPDGVVLTSVSWHLQGVSQFALHLFFLENGIHFVFSTCKRHFPEAAVIFLFFKGRDFNRFSPCRSPLSSSSPLSLAVLCCWCRGNPLVVVVVVVWWLLLLRLFCCCW